MVRLHNLKTVQPFFDDVISGRKLFEVRFNDRDYQVGEQVRLWGYDAENQRHTGWASPLMRITYVLDNPEFCKEGYVVFGLEPLGLLTCYKMTAVVN